MDDGLTLEDSRNDKMGATGNAARLAALQERKKKIEDLLIERNSELRQLCIKEAELTGIMPLEIPLEPGESPPAFRRHVGTSFQLSQNLINNLNCKDESIAALELRKQIQANLAEAALGLANEPNSTKTIKRQHKAQYQYHKQQYNLIEEKLSFLKAQMAQQKQKKKPRPVDQEDAVSIGTAANEPFGKTVLRHSMRSLQHPPRNEVISEQRYSSGHQRLAYRASDTTCMDPSPVFLRPDDILPNGVYRLSISGYKNYMERRESSSSVNSAQYVQSQSNPNIYLHQASPTQIAYGSSYPSSSSTHYDYYKYNSNMNVSKASPSTSNSPLHQKVQYYPSHTIHGQSSYKQYPNVEQTFRTLNPHQLQPHQQYEHEALSTGLGGYWKRNESGEMVWYNSGNSYETSWQRDRRFGSLDRRKNKRLLRRASPLMDTKSTAMEVTPCQEQARVSPVKHSQVVNRNRPDSRQLVRTQSLGSVGAQTVDNIWPSDDNSSCDNDNISINDLSTGNRKQKQKEWYETSLDGPPVSRCQSTVPSVTPVPQIEEKPVNRVTQLPPVQKAPLEIPAESNPSPRMPETNMELFNNNIPKNCTIVQAGICKPYHEETKPFEMSDFYKYSTKFKKSPQKPPGENVPRNIRMSPQRNLLQDFENDNAHKNVYQPLHNKLEEASRNMGEWYMENGNSESPSKNATLV